MILWRWDSRFHKKLKSNWFPLHSLEDAKNVMLLKLVSGQMSIKFRTFLKSVSVSVSWMMQSSNSACSNSLMADWAKKERSTNISVLNRILCFLGQLLTSTSWYFCGSWFKYYCHKIKDFEFEFYPMTHFGTKLTVSTVWNTGETGDI